jgi:hypothetical protein
VSTAGPSVPPTPEGGRPYGAGPWGLVGGGGAIAIVGAILLPIGMGNVSSASNACPTRMNCAASVADQGNTGRTEVGAGWGLLGVGVADRADRGPRLFGARRRRHLLITKPPVLEVPTRVSAGGAGAPARRSRT